LGPLTVSELKIPSNINTKVRKSLSSESRHAKSKAFEESSAVVINQHVARVN